MEPGNLQEAVQDPQVPAWQSPTSIGGFLPELWQFDASFDSRGRWRVEDGVRWCKRDRMRIDGAW